MSDALGSKIIRFLSKNYVSNKLPSVMVSVNGVNLTEPKTTKREAFEHTYEESSRWALAFESVCERLSWFS